MNSAIRVATGILAVLTATANPVLGQAVDAQSRVDPPADKPVVTSPYLVIVRDEAVQEELQLSATQRRAVRRLTDRLDGPLWKVRGLPPRQNAAALEKLITEARLAMDDSLTGTQRKRLDQIVLRVQGNRSLLLGRVEKDLKLTGDQVQRIVATLAETKSAIARLGEEVAAKDPAEDRSARLKQIQSAEQRKIADILDQQQGRQWVAMLGKPFDTSRLGRVKFKAPDLDGAGGWINSPPLRMADLRGKVVALHFWTYG